MNDQWPLMTNNNPGYCATWTSSSWLPFWSFQWNQQLDLCSAFVDPKNHDQTFVIKQITTVWFTKCQLFHHTIMGNHWLSWTNHDYWYSLSWLSLTMIINHDWTIVNPVDCTICGQTRSGHFQMFRNSAGHCSEPALDIMAPCAEQLFEIICWQPVLIGWLVQPWCWVPNAMLITGYGPWLTMVFMQPWFFIRWPLIIEFTANQFTVVVDHLRLQSLAPNWDPNAWNITQAPALIIAPVHELSQWLHLVAIRSHPSLTTKQHSPWLCQQFTMTACY